LVAGIKLQDWKKSFAFFNNTASEAGILDALTFQQIQSAQNLEEEFRTL
jgi:hypothetical protein